MKHAFAVLMMVTSALCAGAAFADFQRGIRNYQAVMAGHKRVDQLTSQELNEVMEVMKGLDRQQTAQRTSRPSYRVEVSHNDEVFIINGEKFEAQTYCFDMEEGDSVIFIDGDAN